VRGILAPPISFCQLSDHPHWSQLWSESRPCKRAAVLSINISVMILFLIEEVIICSIISHAHPLFGLQHNTRYMNHNLLCNSEGQNNFFIGAFPARKVRHEVGKNCAIDKYFGIYVKNCMIVTWHDICPNLFNNFEMFFFLVKNRVIFPAGLHAFLARLWGFLMVFFQPGVEPLTFQSLDRIPSWVPWKLLLYLCMNTNWHVLNNCCQQLSLKNTQG